VKESEGVHNWIYLTLYKFTTNLNSHGNAQGYEWKEMEMPRNMNGRKLNILLHQVKVNCKYQSQL
jgi:hypothetical protein